MIVWLKAIHIAGIMVWCAGLLVLPAIYARRTGLHGERLHDLQRFARTVFINVTSPAAFVAVIAGTILIFLRDVFTVWMVIKLFAIGVLVIIHLRQGYIILSLFDPDRRYARWRQYAMTAATVTTIAAILLVVLAKPDIAVDFLPATMFRPGGLQSLLDTMMPMP